ncbi:universal stress protein [Roseateles sp. SL47]|uniref:universal stress protein n=1 Tax=Roseateles sp. SL47 TaxID=2995138 RepID=UPI00226F7D63|nr:universal stress protein [Roseateles sp. SL47]WAC75675.1 universal stress protein [Roseateles sp. SL47]
MFRKMLVAYDGSSPSLAALNTALGLARGQPTELMLTLVLDDLPLDVEMSSGAMLEASRQARQTEAELVLAKARARVTQADLPCDCAILEADGRRTAEVIVAHAEREHAGLIVIGSHGRRGVSRALLGSDAELVARLSPVPVLIVKEPSSAT